MRHHCCDCNKLFPEKEMVLNQYHDGQDWYCIECYKKMRTMVDDFYERHLDFMSKKSSPIKNEDLTKENHAK